MYPAWATLYHQASSDAVFATGLALWALVLTRALQRPATSRFVVLGAGIAVLALIRPANQVLLRNRRVTGVEWGGWALKHPEENARMLDDVGTPPREREPQPDNYTALVRSIEYGIDPATESRRIRGFRAITGLPRPRR